MHNETYINRMLLCWVTFIQKLLAVNGVSICRSIDHSTIPNEYEDCAIKIVCTVLAPTCELHGIENLKGFSHSNAINSDYKEFYYLVRCPSNHQSTICAAARLFFFFWHYTFVVRHNRIKVNLNSEVYNTRAEGAKH